MHIILGYTVADILVLNCWLILDKQQKKPTQTFQAINLVMLVSAELVIGSARQGAIFIVFASPSLGVSAYPCASAV